jgi:hypothetical protein
VCVLTSKNKKDQQRLEQHTGTVSSRSYVDIITVGITYGTEYTPYTFYEECVSVILEVLKLYIYYYYYYYYYYSQALIV